MPADLEHIHKLHRRLIAMFFVLIIAVGVTFGPIVAIVPDVLAISPPNIISYQGRVLNTAGVPVSNATASMQFEIYTASSGGSCIWSNDSASCNSGAGATGSQTVSLTEGLFSENLGDTADGYAAIADSVFADNSDLYLEVTINGETLTPRKRITAQGFALNADFLDGFDSSQIGGTSAIVPVTDSTGNLTLTGDPQSTAVSGGVVYINPAAADPNETIFGIGLGGSSRFRVDEDGDIILVNEESISNSTNGQIDFIGSGGASDATLSLDLDDATGPVLSSAGDIQILNDLVVGSSTAAGETLNNTGFALGGDDLFVAGVLGVESGIYTDGTLSIDRAEDTAQITLSDTTNTDSVSVYLGNGTAGLDGTLSAQAGSLFLDENGQLWVNIDGLTDWQLVATTNAATSLLDLDAAYDNDTDKQLNVDNTSGLTFDLTTTGDLIVEDAGTAFLTFDDNSNITWNTSTAGAIFTIDAASTDTTATGGLINIDADTATDGVEVMDINIESLLSNAAGTETVAGITLNPVTNVTSGAGTHELYGVRIQNLTETACTAGTCTEYGVRVGTGYEFAGYFEADTVVGPSANGDLLIGGTSETLNNSGFALGGDDAFVAGLLGVEGNVYTDGTISSDAAEDTARLTLVDTTNTDELSIYVGDGTSGLDGTLNAQAGSLFMDLDGVLWINVDGVTDWNRLATTTGSASLLDLDAAYDNDTDKQLDVDSTSGITFDLTTVGDFVIEDSGTAFLTISDTGGFTYDLDATDNPSFTVTDSGTGNVVVNIASTGDFLVQDAGNTFWTFNSDRSLDYTTNQTDTNAFDFTADGLTTGNALVMSADALTSGNAIDVQSTSGALTGGDLIQADHTATYTASATDSGNIIDLTRSLTADGAAVTLTLNGALATLANSGTTANGGTLTDSSNILALSQNYSSASGAVLNLLNAGTGNGAFLDQNGNGVALNIDSEATTANVATLDGSVLTTGAILSLVGGNFTDDSGTALSIDVTESTATADIFKIQTDYGSANNNVFRIEADGEAFSDVGFTAGAFSTNYYDGSLTSTGAYTLTSGGTLSLDSSGAIETDATSLTADAAFTINSTTSSAITVDSGTTGTVNLATGNNAKTVNVGTGNAGNIINVGTDNTTADDINIGSVLDDVDITGASQIVAGTTDPLTLTANATSTWSTTVGALTISSADLLSLDSSGAIETNATSLTADAGFTIASTTSALTLDSGNNQVTLATDDDLIPTLGVGNADIGASGTRWDNIYGVAGDYSGTVTVADLSCTDCLDFTELADSMTLDAATTIDLGANNLTIDMTGTGDTIFASSGSPVLTVTETGQMIHAPSSTIGAPSLTGNWYSLASQTFTDNTSLASTTNPQTNFFGLSQPTLAASNSSVTTTDAATFYIANAPAAGTNMTITNPYALWVDNGNSRFDGTVTATDFSCTDCLDFTELADNMTVDAATTITLGTNTFDIKLDSTGDFSIRDAAAAFFTFNNDRSLDYTTNQTNTNAFDFTADSLTSGNGLAMSVDGLVSGNGLDISSTSAARTSGDLIHLDHTVANTGTLAVSGNLADLTQDLTNTTAGSTLTISGPLQQITRSSTVNNASATVNVAATGSVLSLVNNATQTAGTLTDAGPVLFVDQNSTAATGAVVYIDSESTTANALLVQGANTGTTLASLDGSSLTGGNILELIGGNFTDDSGMALSIDVTETTETADIVNIQTDYGSSNNNVFKIEADGEAFSDVGFTAGAFSTNYYDGSITSTTTPFAFDLTGTGELKMGNDDSIRIRPSDATDNSFQSSPLLILDGSYDSDPTATITPTSYSAEIRHVMTSTVPASQFSFNIGGGPDELTVTSAGNGTFAGDLFVAGGNLDPVGAPLVIDAVAGQGVRIGTGTPTSASAANDLYVTDQIEVDGILNTAGTLIDVNSTDLAGGIGLNVSRATSGSNFSNTTSGLVNFSITDTGSTGNLLYLSNTSSGSALIVNDNDTTTSHLATEFQYADDALQPGVAAAMHIFAESDALAMTSDAATRRAAIFQIETNSESGGGSPDTFNYIAFNEDINGTTDAMWRVDQGGATYADGSYTGTGADYAEYFATNDPSLEPGDVVAFSPVAETVTRSSASYDSAVFGVISTNPGFVGNGIDGLSPAEMATAYPNYKLVALTGQVPVKVSAENGPISVGDPLTSAATAGYAMKATEPGSIIGFALQTHSSGLGTITAYINSGWYAGNVIGTDGASTVINDQIVLNSLGTANSTNSSNSNLLSLRGSGWDGTSAVDLTMNIQNVVEDGSDAYKLSVTNNDGTEVAYVSQNGDLATAGKIYPSDRGTLQTDKYIYYDGSSGPGGDFMRTNAAGWSTGSYDFAEMFPSDQELMPADVVVFAGDGEKVRRSSGSYSGKIAGIVSTRPGFLAGENLPNHYPIALAGRVPTKVTNEGGRIHVGDPLTTSGTSGAAMKATEAGPIVGYALEEFSEGEGEILVFVRAGYYDGGETSEFPGTENSASQIALSSSVSSLNTNGNIYLNGNEILSVARMAGIQERWSIEEDGTFKTEAVYTTVIESHQGEDVEVFATMSPEVTIQLSGTAELSSGSATIEFEKVDPKFNDIISTVAPIRVLVTPTGPTSGPLYVNTKDNNGFTVSELGGSTSGVEFDWLVIAYRDGYEPVDELDIGEPTVETAAAEEEAPAPEATTEETVTEPVAEQASAETPAEETAPVEETTTEETTTEPATEEPVAEETAPAAEEASAPETTITTEPAAEQAPAEETTTEDPAAEETTTDPPATEETPAA